MSEYFPLLLSAYAAAQTGDTIEALAAEFIEDLILDRPIVITLKGGYDCGYSVNGSKTIVQGNLVISAGQVIIDGITFR